jgi:hypothetical protein
MANYGLKAAFGPGARQRVAAAAAKAAAKTAKQDAKDAPVPQPKVSTWPVAD